MTYLYRIIPGSLQNKNTRDTYSPGRKEGQHSTKGKQQKNKQNLNKDFCTMDKGEQNKVDNSHSMGNRILRLNLILELKRQQNTRTHIRIVLVHYHLQLRKQKQTAARVLSLNPVATMKQGTVSFHFRTTCDD